MTLLTCKEKTFFLDVVRSGRQTRATQKTHMKIPLNRSWIAFVLAGLVFPAVIVRGSSDPSDTDPTVFGDGIFNKFNLDLGFAGRIYRWSIYTYGAGTSGSPFTSLDVSG